MLGGGPTGELVGSQNVEELRWLGCWVKDEVPTRSKGGAGVRGNSVIPQEKRGREEGGNPLR